MITSIWTQYSEALLWFAGCTFAGFIVDQILFRWVRSASSARGWRFGEQLAKGLHWLPTWAGITVGWAAAVAHLELAPRYAHWARVSVQCLAILVITAFSARILSRLIKAYTEREDTPLPSGSIFMNLTRGVVWVLGGVMLLGALGISIAPLVTALGVGGLAVGLALQPTLENVFSGIQLLASRQIKPGDFIRLEGGDEGTVLDVTWRNTTVQKVSNDVVIVPNSVLARATVTNFSLSDPEFGLVVPISFSSTVDPDTAQRIALEVAQAVIERCPEAVDDQEPGTSFAELTPPAMVLNVGIRCRSYQQRIPVRNEFIRQAAKRLADEGIEAPPVAMPARAAR